MTKANSKSAALKNSPTKNLRTKLDGWINVLTGLGQKGKDKKASSKVIWDRPDEVSLEEFYAADALARKIVDLPVEEALNKGFKVTGYTKEENDALTKRGKELNVPSHVKDAWIWARLYGGAGIVLVTDGIGKSDTPMSDKEALKAMNVLHRFELYLNFEKIQKDILRGNYGKPEFYSLQPVLGSSTLGKEGANTKNIHASRVVHFEGMKLPKRLKVQNQYWDDSVLNALKDSIRNYQTTHSSAASVVDDFSVGIFKIKNLASQISSDGDEAVIARMQILNLTRSIARAVVIDSEGEDFQYQSRNISGLKDVLDKAESHLVAETKIPNTVLFGNSPAGLGGSGNHETNNWYAYLKAEQETYLKPKLIQIYKNIAIDLKLDPSKLDIEFEPLYQMDEKELAAVRKTQAETDVMYITNQVVDADEVAASRFGGEKYSIETELMHERTPGVTPPAPTPTPGVES